MKEIIRKIREEAGEDAANFIFDKVMFRTTYNPASGKRYISPPDDELGKYLQVFYEAFKIVRKEGDFREIFSQTLYDEKKYNAQYDYTIMMHCMPADIVSRIVDLITGHSCSVKEPGIVYFFAIDAYYYNHPEKIDDIKNKMKKEESKMTT